MAKAVFYGGEIMALNHNEILKIPNNEIISAFYKMDRHLATHTKVLCSVSGGSDSDIMIDMLSKLVDEHKVIYVWFDTGVEYQATKDHISELEEKYGITIHRRKAVLPIPACCKKYGQPFLSKYVSGMIERLQNHNFKWEDRPFEELSEKYPKCKSALKWWCNIHDIELASVYPSQSGRSSRWSISRNQYLKEFLIENPPQFKISAKCCTYAKKKVSEKAEKEFDPDMLVIGIRKAEGGVRAGAYKSCYSYDEHRCMDVFRPIFWFTDKDKKQYCEIFGVEHSLCYTAYGLKRTGCVGCPFGRKVLDELSEIAFYEPKLYKACTTIFKDSYEYTRQYREYVKKKKEEEKCST